LIAQAQFSDEGLVGTIPERRILQSNRSDVTDFPSCFMVAAADAR